MPILFAIIARGSQILSKYSDCVGNFNVVAKQVIVNIDLNTPKMTYTHGEHLIHYICENRIIYMCITDSDFQRSVAFAFLSDIQNKLHNTYGSHVSNAQVYAMNTDFPKVIAEQMQFYSENAADILIARNKQEVDECLAIMERNIDSIKERGARIDRVIAQADTLNSTAASFRDESVTLSRRLRWSRIRVYVITSLIFVWILYAITSMACGGLAWPKCV